MGAAFDKENDSLRGTGHFGCLLQVGSGRIGRNKVQRWVNENRGQIAAGAITAVEALAR